MMECFKNRRSRHLTSTVAAGALVVGASLFSMSSASAQQVDSLERRKAADDRVCRRKALVDRFSNTNWNMGGVSLQGLETPSPIPVTAADSAFARRAGAELDSLRKAGDTVSFPRMRIVTCNKDGKVQHLVVDRQGKELDKKQRSDPWAPEEPK